MSSTDQVLEGIVAYDLEIKLGRTHEEALSAAIEAALSSFENYILNRTAHEAVSLAEELDDDPDDDLNEDGVAALIWFARELQEEIPAEDRDEW